MSDPFLLRWGDSVGRAVRRLAALTEEASVSFEILVSEVGFEIALSVAILKLDARSHSLVVLGVAYNDQRCSGAIEIVTIERHFVAELNTRVSVLNQLICRDLTLVHVVNFIEMLRALMLIKYSHEVVFRGCFEIQWQSQRHEWTQNRNFVRNLTDRHAQVAVPRCRYVTVVHSIADPIISRNGTMRMEVSRAWDDSVGRVRVVEVRFRPSG